MGDKERITSSGVNEKVEILYPHHFYAAYVFDGAKERTKDISAVIKKATELGLFINQPLTAKQVQFSQGLYVST